MATSLHPWVMESMIFLREEGDGLWILRGDTAERIWPQPNYGVLIEPTGDNDNERRQA